MLPKRYRMLRSSPDLSGEPEPRPDCAGMSAYCLLLFTMAMVALCYATPYWLVEDKPPPGYEGKYHLGMFAQCYGDDCTSYFDKEEYTAPFWPDWFKATQGLMSVGLGLGLLALLVATLSLCCTCHSCNPNVPICVLLITSCLSMAVAMCIFGIKAKDEWDIGIEYGLTTRGRFGWSFWVGIGASALALLTGCMYGCMSRKD